MRISSVFVSVAAVWLLGAGVAAAQSNNQIYAGVQFDVPVPGARALALGGAFVPLADDATAAVANPAGLTTLVRPEISIEGKGGQFTTVTPLRGHAYTAPTNFGIDTLAGITDGEKTRSSGGLAFFSAVFPLRGLSLGVYRHEQARYRAEVLSEGFYSGTEIRTDPFTGTLDVDIVNYGASVAHRFANGLSLGGGVALSDFSISGTTNGYYLFRNITDPIVVANPQGFTAPGLVYGPADFRELNRLNTVTESGDDKGVALNFGALFKPTNTKWSVGGAVRIGPEFDYSSQDVWGPGGRDPFTPGAPPYNTGIKDQDALKFKVPDVYSGGASFFFTDALLFVAQYDFTRFTQLNDNLTDVLGSSVALQEALAAGLKYSDAHAIRFGGEYALASGARVFAIRLGTYFETDHSLVYTQQPNVAVVRPYEILFRQQPDQWHITPGAGFALAKFQVDAAFDYADREQTFSVSAVFRF
jgi:long-chain fatty acid transport protein